jgi:uncharacterized protein (UPF0276 family)
VTLEGALGHQRPRTLPTMFRNSFPFLGAGLGLRRPHYQHVTSDRPGVDWFEVITENFMIEGGHPLAVLEKVRADYPIALHGVSLSIGSSDRLNRDYLSRLKRLADRFDPAWISDHLCWTGTGGHNLHDLMPLPYSEETAAHVSRRIREVQEILGRYLVIENVSSYLAYTQSTLSEWEFLRTVAEEADCGILLDVNNIFVSAFNHRFDAESYIDAIPVERAVQIHLAGHSTYRNYLLDTHDHPIRPEVWRLYDYALRRFGAVSTLIERDDNIPEFSELELEVGEARQRLDAAVAIAAEAPSIAYARQAAR